MASRAAATRVAGARVAQAVARSNAKGSASACRAIAAAGDRRSPFARTVLTRALLPEPFRHLAPVHDVPPRRHVVRTPVLVLEAVRVLPDIQPEQDAVRVLPVHDRVVLVRRARDAQPAPLVHQPHPAGAEAARGG